MPDTTTTGGGDNPEMPDGSYALGRLEGLVEGLKTNQTITFSAIAVLAAVLLALTSWTLFRVEALSGRVDALSGRVDALSDRIADVNAKVDQLPSKISSDLLAIAGALSQAITAARQQPPQIILMPAPQPAGPAAAPAQPAPGKP